jgi:hypothetical protein
MEYHHLIRASACLPADLPRGRNARRKSRHFLDQPKRLRYRFSELDVKAGARLTVILAKAGI